MCESISVFFVDLTMFYITIHFKYNGYGKTIIILNLAMLNIGLELQSIQLVTRILN